MIIMEWIKKITDIIMPEQNDEEDEVKEKQKTEVKETQEAEPLHEAAAEKKSEQAEPQAQTIRQEQSFQKQAMGGGKMFTRTGSVVTTADGETRMNGVHFESFSTEASVKPSLAVVKTAQITLKIYTPHKYDEQVKSIGQDLIKRTAVIVNYEGLDDSVQQRIGDFVLGVVYTINGRVELITNKIVLYAPEGLEVTSAQAALANVTRRYN